MKIQAGYDIAYDLPQPTSMILMLTVHPSRADDLLTPHEIRFSPSVESRAHLDCFGNICTRVLAPAGRLEIKTDFLVKDSGKPDVIARRAAEVDIDKLPNDALQFLLPSRYCDTEALSDLAWSLFGTSKPGWDRVQEIVDYVHGHIAFGYHHARADRTASEGHSEKIGVCRDFAHLAVTLCRCMNIPARYCTGYLGDIGVPKDPAPMDFSAWFEVFLGGRWYTFDARHNVPRIGRIVIARGRDAADVAISTSFGPAKLAKFQVVTDEIKGPSSSNLRPDSRIAPTPWNERCGSSFSLQEQACKRAKLGKTPSCTSVNGGVLPVEAFMDTKKSDLERFKENVEQYKQGKHPDSRDPAEDETSRPSKPLQKQTGTDESPSR